LPRPELAAGGAGWGGGAACQDGVEGATIDHMRLADISPLHAARLTGACVAACDDPRAHPFFAWNVDADAWYGSDELDRIRNAFDAPGARLDGRAFLEAMVRALKGLREVTAAEAAHLPAAAVNHRAWRWFGSRYDLAPDSAMVHGGLPGEPPCAPAAGDRFDVLPRRLHGPGAPRGVRAATWLTFDTAAEPVPKGPDEVSRRLGLTVCPDDGPLVRIEVRVDELQEAGTVLALPTVFDGIYPASPTADWRARPAAEQRPDEPWGLTRDLEEGGSALPEVLAELDSTRTRHAECLGTPCRKWGDRPYLGGAPR
jgi:hypothetical protein